MSNDYGIDGKDHILITKQGKTDLGRQLSMGWKRPFKDSQHGMFASILAFYMWYDSNGDESLRHIDGSSSPILKSSRVHLPDREGNRSEVTRVLKDSIMSNDKLVMMLKQNDLPLEQYALVGETNTRVVELRHLEWYLNAIRSISDDIKRNH